MRSPVFTAVAILSLALGIGANSAVFTLLDHVLLGRLPVRNPGELVQLKELGAHYGSNTGINSLSYPIYRDFRDQNQVFSGMFCRRETTAGVTYGGRNERATIELVSGTYFPVLGVPASLGRVFTPEEDRTRSGAPLAVLGYDYWKTRFTGDRSILGREILVNNRKLTVVGVAQPGFEGTERLFPTQIYVPIAMAKEIEDRDLDDRRFRWVQVFGRLKPGVSIERAGASLQPIFHRILAWEVQQKEFAHASPFARERFLRMTLQLTPGGGGQNAAAASLAAPLWAVMAMVALVLLIACANVANLLIARAAGRQKEMAVRLALGAGRARIVRQLLLETTLLSLAGGALGFAIAPWTMRFLDGIVPQFDPPLNFITAPNLRVLCFTLGVCALSALLFGLAPALRASRPNLAPTLKEQGGAVAGGGQAGWRKALVAAQVALSLLLLIAAGLFVRSLSNLEDLNPGFDVNHLLSFTIGDPTRNGYKTEDAKFLYQRVTRGLAALPGVQSAAMCLVAPLTFDEWDNGVTVEGYTPKPGEDMNPWVNYVSPGFFATLKIPLHAGRDFTDRDATGAPSVAVVNERFARHFFGGRPALGRHFGLGTDPGTKTDIEIVGVVGDTKYETMHSPSPEQMFLPYLQNTWVSQMTAYVRTDLGSAQMFPVLRATVQKQDATLPVYLMKTEERQRDDSLSIEKLAATLATAFGALATVLAAVGLYGVMAFLVARRTREIGIRMTLGAATGSVVWLVVREVLLLVAIGTAIGLPAALGLTRLLSSQLYGIAPSDPATVVLATLGIAATAALAAYIPARRAARVDPVTALRYE
jgi:predicted permease